MNLTEPTYLAKINAHERDSHVIFDEGPHIYTVDGDSSFTSVTTWNHSHFGHFDADKIIDNMMNGRNWKPGYKYYGMTKDEIKASWDKNRDESAAAGTKMHYDIECYYNLMDIKNDSIEYKWFLQFDDWVKRETNMLPYRTEMIVWDKELKLCGSIDMMYMNECGEIELYDWKRCKEIKKTSWNKYSTTECIGHLPDSNYWHYSLQLNTYKYMLEKNYGLKVNGMYLVCLHPNNKTKTFMKIKVPVLEEEIKDLMALKLKMVEEEKLKKSEEKAKKKVEKKETIWDLLEPVKKKKKNKECYVCKKTKGTKVYIVDQYLMGLEKYRYCKKCANIQLNNYYPKKGYY
jgi:hypothetical protein